MFLKHKSHNLWVCGMLNVEFSTEKLELKVFLKMMLFLNPDKKALDFLFTALVPSLTV